MSSLLSGKSPPPDPAGDSPAARVEDAGDAGTGRGGARPAAGPDRERGGRRGTAVRLRRYHATVVAALELYLDQEAERRVKKLWTALAEAGIPSMRDLLAGRHRPHVSLISAPRLDGPAVAAALHGVDVAPPLRLRFDYVGLFLGRVLWLGPVPTAELLAHHAAVHERLAAAGVTGFDVYLPGRWVPHCTLSMRVPRPQVSEAVRLCMDFLPIEATVTGAAVADYARDLFLPL